tara:strand:+ start:583 stop:1182 length:600 start_codon:yes stop_codon:yes gene_type:complete
MKIKIQSNITKILFLSILFFSISSCDQKIEKEFNKNARIDVKIFSSLTCPYCANFHKKVVLKIKKDNALNNIVNFEHIGFPLDEAALNGEKILYCSKNQENRFELLTHLYNEQNNWASGSNINDINESLRKIANKFKINDTNVAKCLKDENLEEEILKKMLDARKKFKIESTPTVFINEKKYEGKHNFKSFKKEVEKLL